MKQRNLVLLVISAMGAVILACAAPAWINTAEADAEVAVPIAASLVDVIDPPLAPLVSLIQKGFTALVDTLNTYKSTPSATNLQAVQAAFQAVDAHVAQLESAAQIKNSATQATVTQVVQLLAQVVTEIAAQVPKNAGLGIRAAGRGTESSAPLRVQGQARGWKAGDFKQQFNDIIKGDSRFAGKEIK